MQEYKNFKKFVDEEVEEYLKRKEEKAQRKEEERIKTNLEKLGLDDETVKRVFEKFGNASRKKKILEYNEFSISNQNI